MVRERRLYRHVHVYYDVVWWGNDVYNDMSMSITMSFGIGTTSITTCPNVVIDVFAGVIDVVNDMRNVLIDVVPIDSYRHLRRQRLLPKIANIGPKIAPRPPSR